MDQDQRKLASTKHRRLRKRWIALVLVVVSVAVWKWSHPSYQGHDMHYWFDVYTRDGVREDLSKPNPPLSGDQQKALDAFRHFEEKGLVFLIDLATQDVKPTPFVKEIQSMLESFPWHPRHSFEMDRYYQIASANDLLKQLGIPFEAAQQYAKAYEGQSDPEMVAKGLSTYQWVTNHFDLVEDHIQFYLDHEIESVQWSAHLALFNIARNTEFEPPEWIEKVIDYPNYYLFIEWAPKSERIKNHLIANSKSFQSHKSLKALACLSKAFPNSKSYREQLLKKLKDTAAGSSVGLGSNLNFLVSIQFPFKMIYPELIEMAKTSAAALIYVAELLRDHDLDVTPLIPHLEEALRFPRNNYLHSTAHLTASLFLLKQDIHHPKVWNYIEDMYQSNTQKGTIEDRFTGMIQNLAPHCQEAQDILDKYPQASKRLPMPNVSAANFRLRQHRLPPFE